MQKRKSYGSYIPKVTNKYNVGFKKFAEKVISAAGEAKKMTCRIGTGATSNVPFGCFYLSYEEIADLTPS